MINNIDHITKYNTLSLLPHAANSQFISKQQKLDELNLTKTIIEFAITALNSFIEGNLVLFDAQVGENLCQIRAYKILHLAKKWLHSPISKLKLQEQIKQLKNHQEQIKATVLKWEEDIKESKSFNKNLDGTEDIGSFFERHQAIFELDEDLIFIIVCRFLTHFNIRDNNIPVAIDLKKIASEFNISKYRSKRLMHRYQQLVCKIGCDFIINIAKELPRESNYTDILPSLYKISDEDRVVLPCYIVSDIIFNHAIQEKIPVLLIVNRFDTNQQRYDVIYFYLQEKNGSMKFSLKPCDKYLMQHCMVVSGETYNSDRYDVESPENYISHVLTANPLKLILANTAIHPQYSGKRLESLRENPFHSTLSDCEKFITHEQEKKLVEMQNFAIHAGCSKQNPSIFLLKHIYANTVLNETNKLKSSYTGCAFAATHEKTTYCTIGQIYGRKESIIYKSI